MNSLIFHLILMLSALTVNVLAAPLPPASQSTKVETCSESFSELQTTIKKFSQKVSKYGSNVFGYNRLQFEDMQYDLDQLKHIENTFPRCVDAVPLGRRFESNMNDVVKQFEQKEAEYLRITYRFNTM